MTRFRVWSALALVAGLFVAVGGTTAQQPRLGQFKVIPGQPKVLPMPGAPVAELPLVPKSSSAFISLKVSDIVDHPDLKPVLEQLKKMPEVFEGLTEAVGLAPHELDRITLFWPVLGADGPDSPVLVVTTREAYNEARVLKALRAMPVFDGRRNMHRHDHDRDPFGPGQAPRGGVKQARPDFGKGDEVPLHPPLSKSVPPERFDPPKGPIPDPRPLDPEKKTPADDDRDTVSIAAAIPAEPLFYELGRGGFEILFLVDERTLVFLPGRDGSETAMLALMGQLMQKKATGPLADAISAGGTHTFAAGIHLTPLFREFGRHMPGELAPYAALLSARTAVLTGDLGKSAKLSLKLSFDDAAAARRAGPVLEEGIRTVAELITEKLADLKANGRPSEKIHLPVIEAAVAGLKKAMVKAEGSVVVASGELDVGPAAAKAATEVLQTLAARKKYIVRTNNLKQIGIALHNYESATGQLPSNVYGPKGEPLLSWRVELLPYLEQDNLYRQFRRDEAWDGPNNKKLIEQMPKLFDIPEREAPKGHTYFQAFISPDPAKPPPKGGNQFFGRTWLVDGGKNRMTLSRIPDGTANTIGVVEAGDSVVWSKPDDLPFGEKLAPLGEAGAERFLALFLDGSVRAISTKTKPEVLRILIDGQDGQVTPDLGDEDDFPRLFPFFMGSKRAATSSAPKAAVSEPAGIRELEEFNLLRDEVERSRAELARAEAEQDVAAAQHRRVVELVDKGVGNKKDLDEAKAQFEVSQQRAKVAALRLRETEDRLAVVQNRLERLGVIPATKPAPRPIEKK